MISAVLENVSANIYATIFSLSIWLAFNICFLFPTSHSIIKIWEVFGEYKAFTFCKYLKSKRRLFPLKKLSSGGVKRSTTEIIDEKVQNEGSGSTKDNGQTSQCILL